MILFLIRSLDGPINEAARASRNLRSSGNVDRKPREPATGSNRSVSSSATAVACNLNLPEAIRAAADAGRGKHSALMISA